MLVSYEGCNERAVFAFCFRYLEYIQVTSIREARLEALEMRQQALIVGEEAIETMPDLEHALDGLLLVLAGKDIYGGFCAVKELAGMSHGGTKTFKATDPSVGSFNAEVHGRKAPDVVNESVNRVTGTITFTISKPGGNASVLGITRDLFLAQPDELNYTHWGQIFGQHNGQTLGVTPDESEAIQQAFAPYIDGTVACETSIGVPGQLNFA